MFQEPESKTADSSKATIIMSFLISVYYTGIIGTRLSTLNYYLTYSSQYPDEEDSITA